jgi:hypothetical protein
MAKDHLAGKIAVMKKLIPTTVGVMLLAGTLLISRRLSAQTVEVTQAMSAAGVASGIVNESSSERIIVETALSPEPLHYIFSKSTSYVDESGLPISAKAVKSGLPVTVRYTKVGTLCMVDQVILKKAVVTELAVSAAKPAAATTTLEPTK